MAICWAAVVVCGGSRLLHGCRRLAAGVVCSGGGCVTWHGDGVLRWWWLGVEE